MNKKSLLLVTALLLSTLHIELKANALATHATHRVERIGQKMLFGAVAQAIARYGVSGYTNMVSRAIESVQRRIDNKGLAHKSLTALKYVHSWLSNNFSVRYLVAMEIYYQLEDNTKLRELLRFT